MTATSRNRILIAIIAVGILTLLFTMFARPRPLPATAPPLPPAPVVDANRHPTSGLTYALDAASANGHQTHPPAVLTVHPGATVYLAGWALDARTLQPASAVTVALDHGKAVPAAGYRESRPDVSKALSNPDAQLSGFHAAIKLAGIARGHHRITVSTMGADGQAQILPTPVELLVQ